MTFSKLGTFTLASFGTLLLSSAAFAGTPSVDLIPDARLTWIDNCGHAPQIECAEQFGAIAAGVINELNAQASQSEADSEVA